MKWNLSYSKIAIVLLLVICGWYGRNLDSWGRNRIIMDDVISYYGYLPAALIFKDLNFRFMKDLPSDHDARIWYGTAENGKPVLRMTMGLSLLWTPFFLLAHASAPLLGATTLGYSWPYSLSIFIAALFYLALGLIFLRRILLNYFSEAITALTLVLLVAATNLMHYVISEPGVSHVYNFSLITLFLFVSLKWTRKPTITNGALLGALAGLIVLIRPVNGLVLVFPLLIGINTFKEMGIRLLNNWKSIVLAAVAAVLIVLPQLIYWKIQTGHLFYNSYQDSGKFFLSNPHIINGLIGFRKGWLVYTPVMLLSVTGLIVLKRYVAGIRLAILVFLPLFVYVIFSWWCWWYGGSFGSRPMIDIYGILALPLAASLTFLFQSRGWVKIASGIALAALLSLNQFQMGQYRTSVIHWDSMTWQAYRAVFLKENAPANFGDLIRNPDYEKALRGN